MKKSEEQFTIEVVKAPKGTLMYKVPDRIIEDFGKLTSVGFRLIIIMCNKKFESIDDLVGLMNVSKSTVNRAIVNLKKCGYLTSYGRGRNCTYTLNV